MHKLKHKHKDILKCLHTHLLPHMTFSMQNKSLTNNVLSLLTKFQVEHSIHPNGQIKVTWCPLCPKPHHNARDNMNTLNIKGETGQFNCFRCSSQGSYYDLKNQLFGMSQELTDNTNMLDFQQQSDESRQHYQQQSYQGSFKQNQSSFNQFTNNNSNANPYLQPIQSKASFQDIQSLERSTLNRISNLSLAKYQPSLEYLNTIRGLSLETLSAYHVGFDHESFADINGVYSQIGIMAFPMFRQRSKKERKVYRQDETSATSLSCMNYEMQRIKIRGVTAEDKQYMRIQPAGQESLSLFGLHLVDSGDSSIVITEGELDAMSVYQQTGVKAVSLPNGASHMPLQCVPYFEQFTYIYLWMDGDAQGQLNVDKIAQKLGKDRVRIVNSQYKDANEALQKEPESIGQSLLKSKTLLDEHVITFEQLKETLKDKMLNHELDMGIQSGEFGFMNARLKGLRKGEFTIVTGGTGSGKTTLLSQLSLDYSQQGVRTLWGSFEVQNHTLLQTMMLQYSRTNLYQNMNQYDYFSDRMTQLPLFFMNYYGATDVDQMLSTIEYTIYKYDINMIVLDNLQFFLGTQATGFNKFDLQDTVISKLRSIATEKQVHIMLVIHPRKVDEKEDLQVSSVFGSAKATQEADNIFIIQNRHKYKELQLKKNRFSGDIGEVFLGFDKETKRFIEMTQVQQKLLESNGQSFRDIYQQQEYEEQQDVMMMNALQQNNKNQRQRQNKFQVERGNNEDGNNSQEEQLKKIQEEYEEKVRMIKEQQQQKQNEDKSNRNMNENQNNNVQKPLYNQVQNTYNTQQQQFDKKLLTINETNSDDEIQNYVLQSQEGNEQFNKLGFYNDVKDIPQDSFIDQQLTNKSSKGFNKTNNKENKFFNKKNHDNIDNKNFNTYYSEFEDNTKIDMQNEFGNSQQNNTQLKKYSRKNSENNQLLQELLQQNGKSNKNNN